MAKIQIVLPLPPECCSPNFRGHTKGRGVGQYRDSCALKYRTLKLKPFTRFPVVVHLDYYLGYFMVGKRRLPDGRYRPKDEDGGISGFKAGQDALKLAGLVPDDNSNFVKSGDCNLHRTKKQHGGRRELVVTLEYPDDD